MNTVGGLVASLGLGALSSAIGGAKGSAPSALSFEDQPTTLATRGAYIPVVYGRRKVAPVIGWAGDRITQAVRRGKKGGGRTVTGFKYFEAAMHLLGAGEMTTLHAVEVDGTPIYQGPLAQAAGSGVMISLTDPHAGTAYVYFGERCQPINTRLAAGSGSGTEGIGVASRWPRMIYVEHRRAFLGNGPIWPEMTYDIECRRAAPIQAAPDWIGESAPGAGDDGVNPAHALWTALFAPYPVGAGLDPALAACDCFNALALLFAGEHAPLNFSASGGIDAARFVGFMLQETQTVLPHAGGLLAPRAMREAVGAQLAALATVTPDAYAAAGPTIDRDHAPTTETRIAYAFDERASGYRVQTLRRDADAAIAARGRLRERVRRLDTVTDAATASIIADRMAALDLAPTTRVRVTALRAGVDLIPGDQFKLTTPDGVTRVCSVTEAVRAPLGAGAAIDAVQMRYGLPPSITQPQSVAPTPASPGPSPDTRFTALEIPRAAIGVDEVRIGVLRVRAGVESVGSTILYSSDGVSFAELGQNNGYTFGGVLDGALPIGATMIGLAADGPTITEFNADIAEAEDLTDPSLADDWRTGRQVAVIGEGAGAEIVFVRALTSLGAGVHRLESVIRGRMDTPQRAHAMGDPVYFVGAFDGARVTPLRQTAFGLVRRTVFLKSDPFGATGVVDPALVTAQQLAVVARAASPLTVDNLTANGSPDSLASYSSGQDITLRWTYRVRDGVGSAAGEQGAGDAVGARPPREGPFEIEVWSGAPLTLVRTITLDSDDTNGAGAIYLAATNAADHGGSPASSLTFMVAMRRGALIGPQSQITVPLV